MQNQSALLCHSAYVGSQVTLRLVKVGSSLWGAADKIFVDSVNNLQR